MPEIVLTYMRSGEVDKEMIEGFEAMLQMADMDPALLHHGALEAVLNNKSQMLDEFVII